MIYIGSDHGGYLIKEAIKKKLTKLNLEFTDLGTCSAQPVDYPPIAQKVSNQVVSDQAKGILICGTGTGMCIAANKVKGVRAAVAWDIYTAEKSRQDNDANILCLSGRNTNLETALKIVEVWLNTDFSGEERQIRRLEQIKLLEI